MTESIVKSENDKIKEKEEEIKAPRKRGYKEYAIGMITAMTYVFFIVFAGSNLLKTAKYYTTPEGAVKLIQNFPISSESFNGKWTKPVEPTENPIHFVINSIVRTNLQSTNFLIFKIFSILTKLSPWDSKLRGGLFYLLGMPLIILLSIVLFVLGPLISIFATTESIIMDVFNIPSIINKFISGEVENFIGGLEDMEAGNAAAAAAADAEMAEGAAEIIEAGAEVDIGGIVMIILAIVAFIIYTIFVLTGLGTVATNSIAIFLSVVGILTFYTNYSLQGSLASWGMAALLSLVNLLSPFGISSLYQVFKMIGSLYINLDATKKMASYNPAIKNMETLGLFALLLSIITAFVNLDTLSATSLTLGISVFILYVWFSN